MTKTTFTAYAPQPALRAMRPMPQGVIGGARTHATPTQIAELRLLIPAMCARYGEPDVARCLADALDDPFSAIEAYRLLASLKVP